MILDDIVADKRKRLAIQKEQVSFNQMKEQALLVERSKISFYDALEKEGLSIIGEFKKASPSMGVIENKISLSERMKQYNCSVDAVSCLTEEDYFNGSAEYLKEIRGLSKLPILRKDFIIDSYQIYEAKVIGADAILLIAAILNDKELKDFYQLACVLGLDVLLEVHEREEMLRGIQLGAKIIGMNNRNLKDFTIHLSITKELVDFLDSQNLSKRPLLVSESGVSNQEDIVFLKECKVNALLIGRAFMESENPEILAKEWKQVFE